TLACGLSACGGTPLVFDDATPFGPVSDDEVTGLSNSFDQLSSQVLSLSPTPSGGMDTTGRATFTGMAEMTVSPTSTSDSMTLIGDAVLIANFETRAVTASMDNFAGVDMSGAAQRLDGRLTMNDGSIGALTSNSLVGTFQGTLAATDFVVVTNGQLDGTFRDTPTTALSFTGVDDTASINGEGAQLTLSGIAQD
ncbi:MAG: hypothetical protein AAFP98_11250, partial [Pseudomonadota bacterium]